MSTEPLTPERLAEIRQRAVVTPPWYCVSEIAAWDTSTEPRGTNAAAEWLTVQLNSAYAKGRQHSDVPDLLDEITRLQQFKMAFDEWMKKTEWVQTSELPTRLLGRHRADVMRLEIERLTAALAAVTANRDPVGTMAEAALVDTLTDEDIDKVLERYDQTDPKLQRRIFAELALRAGQVDELEATLEDLEATLEDEEASHLDTHAYAKRLKASNEKLMSGLEELLAKYDSGGMTWAMSTESISDLRKCITAARKELTAT